MRSFFLSGQTVAASALVLAAWACRDAGAPPPIVLSADSADQVIFGLTHTVTVDGILRARLQSDTAYFYEATQMYDLIGVEVTFYSNNGEESSNLLSETGTYNVRTGDMQARINVVGHSSDGRVLRTDSLNYLKLSHELEGPVAFTLNCEGRVMRGSSFRADPDFTNVKATQLRGPPCLGGRP